MIASEAAEEKKDVSKYQTQELTDLMSFNAFAYVTLSDGQTVGVQVTGRHGIPAARAYQDFKAFVAFLDMCATDSGVKFLEKRAGTYSSEANGNGAAKAESKADGDKPKRNYKDPLTEAEKPAELADVTEDVYAAEFDYFIIKPDLDGKSVVEFWKDGLEFPVGAKMNKWKYDTIKTHLARLTEQEIDPSKAEKYRISGVQYWVKGNEYTYKDKTGAQKTTNYKNIVLLKPSF